MQKVLYGCRKRLILYKMFKKSKINVDLVGGLLYIYFTKTFKTALDQFGDLRERQTWRQDEWSQ